jgi:hypothetical protein
MSTVNAVNPRARQSLKKPEGGNGVDAWECWNVSENEKAIIIVVSSLSQGSKLAKITLT